MDSTLPPPPLLDPGDMESERTPAQLLQWVEQKVQEFYDWHDELRRNLPSEQYYSLEEEFYLDRRTKKFFEELRPLAGLVTKKWLFGRDVRVKPMLSSKNYDAVVILPEEGAFNVEITTTIRGQQAVIQREHMRKYGIILPRMTSSIVDLRRRTTLSNERRSRR